MPALRAIIIPFRGLSARLFGMASAAAVTLWCATALAQGKPPSNAPPGPPPSKLVTGLDRVLTDVEFVLALAVLGFGLIALAIQSIMFWQRFTSPEFIKLTAATLVVTATLFLIASGFSNDQIAPAIGLFGTMLGYILGRDAAQPRRQGDNKHEEGRS